YDQEIEVETEIAALNARMVEFSYRILVAGTNKLLARGSTKHLWLNREMRPSRLPEKYLDILRVP
ncbi:MAG: acyl-CoA thioesterase, partial [Bryobacteraceae bacterium]